VRILQGLRCDGPARALDTSDPFELDDASTERYIYDDATGIASPDRGNVILDFLDPDGEEESESLILAKRYLYGAAVDQLLAQEDVTESISSADRVLWPLTDHLQTVRDLIDNSATLSEHYEYNSFGHLASGDSSLTRYLFTSRELDPATGLQSNRARWYDAAVGRWLGEDPLSFAAADANLARYSHNAVLFLVDPSGLLDAEYYTTPQGQQQYSEWFATMAGVWASVLRNGATSLPIFGGLGQSLWDAFWAPATLALDYVGNDAIGYHVSFTGVGADFAGINGTVGLEVIIQPSTMTAESFLYLGGGLSVGTPGASLDVGPLYVTIPDGNAGSLVDLYSGWFHGVSVGGGPGLLAAGGAANFGSTTLFPQLSSGYPSNFTGVNSYGLTASATTPFPGGAVNHQTTHYFPIRPYLEWLFGLWLE